METHRQPIQKACGFEDTTEAMYAFLEAATGPDPDTAKLTLYCEGSLEHFRRDEELLRATAAPATETETETDRGDTVKTEMASPMRKRS